MTLNVLFLGSDLFDPNDLSREEIGLTRTDNLKNTQYRYQQERGLRRPLFTLLLHRRRCISDI